MTEKKKRRKGYLSKKYKKMRSYEVRDYFARKMVTKGVTVEQFNKLVGIKTRKKGKK